MSWVNSVQKEERPSASQALRRQDGASSAAHNCGVRTSNGTFQYTISA